MDRMRDKMIRMQLNKGSQKIKVDRNRAENNHKKIRSNSSISRSNNNSNLQMKKTSESLKRRIVELQMIRIIQSNKVMKHLLQNQLYRRKCNCSRRNSKKNRNCSQNSRGNNSSSNQNKKNKNKKNIDQQSMLQSFRREPKKIAVFKDRNSRLSLLYVIWILKAIRIMMRVTVVISRRILV